MTITTLLEFRKLVAQQLGLDYTNTTTGDLIDKWINLAYEDIVGDFDWNWLQNRETVTMDPDFTTGTVSVAAASSTITFSAGPTASQAGRYIQFSSANDWYKITAHVAASVTATISPAYIQTANLVAGTFIIRTFYYSLSSACEKVYSCKEATSPHMLGVVSAEDMDTYDPFSDTTGTPELIALWGQDASGYWTFTPHPFPDAILLLEFRTYQRVSSLSSDSSIPLFPSRFDSVLFEGAICYGYQFCDDTRADSAFRKFYLKIDRLKNRNSPTPSKMYVLEAVDRKPSRPYYIKFPDKIST